MIALNVLAQKVQLGKPEVPLVISPHMYAERITSR